MSIPYVSRIVADQSQQYPTEVAAMIELYTKFPI